MSRRVSKACVLIMTVAGFLMIAPVAPCALENGAKFPEISTPVSRIGRPYSVDDMLAQEAFGAASIDPSERYLVFERQAPYDQAGRFDLGRFSAWTGSSLWIANLEDSASARPLLSPSEGAGHILGPWSPSGNRLLVYRLHGERLQPGVVEIVSGEIRWLDLASEISVFGVTAEWKDDHVLILMVRPDNSLPWHLRTDRDAMHATAVGWSNFAGGDISTVTRLGAGAFSDIVPREPQNALVRVSVDDGIVTELARGWFQDMVLSPDRKRLAVSETGAPQAVDPAVPLLPGDRPMNRVLHLIDLNSGADDRPLVGNLAPGLLAWSSDSRRLLIWRRSAEGSASDGHLVAIHPDTGETEVFNAHGLIPETAPTATTSFTTVFADWMGDMPVLFARLSEASRADWFGLRPSGPINLTARLPAPTSRLEALSSSQVALLAGGRAWKIDRSGRTGRLGDPDDLRPYSLFGLWDPPRLRLNATPRRQWFQALGADDRLYRITCDEAAGGNPPSLSSQMSHVAGEVLASSRRWVVRLSTVNGVQTLGLGRYDRDPRVLARINGYLGAVAFSRPTPISHLGPDKKPLTSWLYPPTVPVQGRFPMVVLTYPGGGGSPQAEPWAFNGQSNLQLMTASGYAVLVPALPRDRYPAEPAAGLTNQILQVVDAALESHPELDPNRVAYWGHSFGGYAGLVAATQTDRFKSYVIAAGLSDLATAWGEFSPTNQGAPWDGLSIRQRAGWAERSQGAMGGPPWSDPGRYIRNSPLFSADRIHSPVLLIQGDRDIVPLTQSQLMFSALWRQNKDVQLLTYGGEDHTLASPANIRDLNRRTLEWLERTLGPDVQTSHPRPAALPTPDPAFDHRQIDQ